MQRVIKRQFLFGCLVGVFMLFYSNRAQSQRPQDNWYQEQIWTKTGGSLVATNGGLSTPSGVAIGSDGRIYVGDSGYSRIQVYLPNGNYSFSITNGFGDGRTFNTPRGMITDTNGDLYVADYGRNSVFVFNANGSFIRTLGGTTGTGDGQLSGVMDVALGPNNEVFVLENGNNRVSVFGTDGSFKRKWGAAGSLAGQLTNPLSIAVSKGGQVYVCQNEYIWQVLHDTSMKEFDVNGLWVRTISTMIGRYSGVNKDYFNLGGASVRLDPGGYPHVVISQFNQISYAAPYQDHNPLIQVWDRNGASFLSYPVTGSSGTGYVCDDFRTPCHAIGRDGTVILCSIRSKKLWVCRSAYRDQFAMPRNAIPMPDVFTIRQRPNSPLVDIDYQVTDADDTNVYACMMVFTNATQSLANCMRSITFAEGTETNLGVGVTANQPHRVTWNAGADLNTKLGDFRVAVLAKDSRQKLLDIHYIRLPADRGMPELKISRSPLVPNDFMQVWWWLLATQDTGIRLTGGKIYGSGGALETKLLCDATGTTADGRTYVYAKMNVREATSQEVQWAKEGALAGNVNQWSPSGITVAGRPMNVNEYGFDTGSWGASAWWVVPLY